MLQWPTFTDPWLSRMTEPSLAPPQNANRFDALDGIRGLAAIAVMVYHFTSHKSLGYLPGAWAAVDLFFILSGFVLAHSYIHKIQGGLSAWRFAALRLIRLAPLYLIGTAIGALAMGLIWWQGEAGSLGAFTYWRGVVLGALMVPNFDLSEWPSGAGFQGGVLFPLNPPAWSLFFELFVNACFFAFIAWGLRIRWPLAVLMMVGLAWLEHHLHEVNPGWGRWNFACGFPRVIAEFTLGAVLYHHRHRVPRVHWALAALLTACLFALFFMGDRTATMLEVFVLAPIVLLCNARLELGGVAQRACHWLGELSYPLYITHMPVFFLGYAALEPERFEPTTRLLVLASLALLVAIALIHVDRAVRRRLMARYHARCQTGHQAPGRDPAPLKTAASPRPK